MASAADLTGRLIKFEVQSTPVELEIISGSVQSQGTVTHYCPTGTNTVQRTVAHSKLVTYSVQAVLITSNLPWVYETLTQLTGVTVTLDRSAGTPDTHASTDAVVNSITHTFSTDNHQIFEMVITADGSYTVPS
jgi:hypothetical protein